MKYVRQILLLGIMLLIASTALAQEEATLAFDIPEGWGVTSPEAGVFQLTLDAQTITIYDPAYVANMGTVEDGSSLAAFLQQVVLGEEAEGQAMSGAIITQDGKNGVALPVDLGDGQTAVVAAMSEADVSVATVLEVAASLRMEAAVAAETSGEPCVVSTDQAKTVEVRVGPGTNRTVVTFLPANTDFTVQGKSIDDSGAAWYRLDKEQVAPGKAVNETWIAAASITESGDCAAVADVDAPPIVPMGDSGGTSGAGSEGFGPPFVPQPGQTIPKGTVCTITATSITCRSPLNP